MATRRTIKALAAITGTATATVCEFTYALGTNGAWYFRSKTCAAHGEVETTKWEVCESPLAALGLDSDSLAGDVAFAHNGNFSNLPGLESWGSFSDVWAFGNCGHRYRLPRV